ncbi:MAG: glutamine-hydrolyzing carbamoyl-phosphate synthase small subunit [Lachnospiraceae bacterium]|nr:glutamine-hydrolyzing carbamoyl-phosphate synthase small subunit [Lachnospiraceae bacterium]
MKKKIILEDGAVFTGNGFGSDSNKMVELVFNTSMVGYQEIISDPSYTDQAVVMTYPTIGNYGICDEDYETLRPSVSGLVVREYCDEPSNFRCKNTLSEIMIKYDISGVEGIDTRMLTRHIRDYGSCKAYIVDESYDTEKALSELKSWVPKTDQVSRVSTKQSFVYKTDEIGKETVPADKNIVAIDCGMKLNILREFVNHGYNVTVVPWNTSAEEILAKKPDGVFVSNGPGNPEDCRETINTIKGLIGKCPIFGICLGHQIISLAYGAKTYKLKFGHRGGNHPVLYKKTGKLEMTSQNHSYAVVNDSLESTGLCATHMNILDNTIEGVECKKDFVFSVQYHPESAPGPKDSAYLFDVFSENIKSFKEVK